MDGLAISVTAVLVALLLVLAPVVWLYTRRRWLSRQTHAFDCSLKPTPSSHWALGVARYHNHELQWFRIFSLSWRPARRFRQGEWTAGTSRPPAADEAPLLYTTGEVMRLTRGEEQLELAVEPAAATGLRSWLESAAPGVARYGSTLD